ncbi:MAG: hypothetical protein ACYS8Z_23255, partial [Planctomycetota bacterium]
MHKTHDLTVQADPRSIEGGGVVWDKDGAIAQDLRACYTKFPKGLGQADIRIGIKPKASGDGEAQDYHWAEFKNVSLRPGEKTDVQVAVAGSGNGGGDGPAKAITEAYEKAPGSKGLKIKVGPSRFKVDSVVRWDGDGVARFEDGMGEVIPKVVYMSPSYSKQAPWMDIANIHISPDSKSYDVLELRVFDHKTREMLSPKGRIGVGYDISKSIVQLRSIGGVLPDSVDVWLRVLHNPADDSVWKLNANAGASVQLKRETMSFRTIKPGRWSYNTKQVGASKPAQINWTKRQDEGEEVCTAVFDISNAKSRLLRGYERYQICAISTDGKRHVPDFPHFVGATSGNLQIIEFDLPAEKVSRFEFRPFHGRDRFYFDNIKLPKIPKRTFEPPPIIFSKATEGQTEFQSDLLKPISLRAQVLPGKRATGVYTRRSSALVKMSPEPYKDLDTKTTFIYDFVGMNVNRCCFTFFDSEGNMIEQKGGRSAGSGGVPGRQSVGYAVVNVPYERIDRIAVSLIDNDPRLTEIAGHTVKVNDPKYVTRFNINRPGSNKVAEAFKEGQLEFDETVGFIVKNHTDDVVHCIDFDTGRIIRIPENIDIQDKAAIRFWAESEGVDAIIHFASLTTVNMAVIVNGTPAWTKLNPDTITQLKAAPLSGGTGLSAIAGEYYYRPFKSSNGRIGILGLSFQSGSGAIPHRLMIKYKLLKSKVKTDVGGKSGRTRASNGYDLTNASDFVRKYFDDWKTEVRNNRLLKDYEIKGEHVLEGETGAVAYVWFAATLENVQTKETKPFEAVYFPYRWHTDKWEGIFNTNGTKSEETEEVMEIYRNRWLPTYLKQVEQGYTRVGSSETRLPPVEDMKKSISGDSGGDSKRYKHISFKEGTSVKSSLRLLANAYEKNIIVSDKVSGRVPVAELFDVTFAEALEAVLGAHRYVIDGKFIRVGTQDEFESIRPEDRTRQQVDVTGDNSK